LFHFIAVVSLLTVDNLFLIASHLDHYVTVAIGADFHVNSQTVDLTDALQINYIHQPYTHLVPDLKGVDPDDAFSSVPYEKGSNLLMYLEQKLGGAGQ